MTPRPACRVMLLPLSCRVCGYRVAVSFSGCYHAVFCCRCRVVTISCSVVGVGRNVATSHVSLPCRACRYHAASAVVRRIGCAVATSQVSCMSLICRVCYCRVCLRVLLPYLVCHRVASIVAVSCVCVCVCVCVVVVSFALLCRRVMCAVAVVSPYHACR